MEIANNESSETKPGRTAGAPRGNKNHLRHGLNPLKRTLYTLGNRALDKRTVAGRALVEWRDDLIRDLGGDVSTQQDAIISLATKGPAVLDVRYDFCDIKTAWPKSTPSPKPPNILASAAWLKLEPPARF